VHGIEYQAHDDDGQELHSQRTGEGIQGLASDR